MYESNTICFFIEESILRQQIKFVPGYTQLTSVLDQTGWGCGYVVVKRGHPLFEVDYDTINSMYNIEVHGGLTYSGYPEDLGSNNTLLKSLDSEDHWVIGFDTAHYGDTLSRWSQEKVRKEAKRLYIQVEKVESLRKVFKINFNLKKPKE